MLSRRSSIPFLILLTVLTVAAVAGAQTTVTVWHPLPVGAATEAFHAQIDEFMRQNPDVIVDVSRPGGYGDTREKSIVAWAGRAAPNIVILEQTHGFTFFADGLFMPLDEFIENDPTITHDDIYPGMRENLTYNGKLYGLPYNTSTLLLYYNRGMFEHAGLPPTAPTTNAELLEYSRRIARDTTGDGLADIIAIDFYAWGWAFEAWIGRNGGRVTNEAGTEYTFNSPEAVEAMEFAQALVNEHRVARYGTGYPFFWNGSLAMRELSTASLANNIDQANQNGIDMWVAPLVCNVECYVPIGGGNMFMFNQGTDAEKEAAWRLMSFLVEADNLAAFSAATGYMAGRRSAIQSPVLQDFFIDEPRGLVTYQQLIHARPRAKVPNWNLVGDELAGTLYRGMFHNNGNVRELLDNIVRYGNQILDEWYAGR